MQHFANSPVWYEPSEDSVQEQETVGGTCVQDWFEQALATVEPKRGPRASWSDDDEEDDSESSSEDSDDEDADVDADEDIQADPFDDFDPEDFDDEFDDDFEEELEDEYEIEPDDDEVMDDIGSPSISVDDGTGSDDEEAEIEDLDLNEDIDE